jgi:hypothetical protein
MLGEAEMQVTVGYLYLDSTTPYQTVQDGSRLVIYQGRTASFGRASLTSSTMEVRARAMR